MSQAFTSLHSTSLGWYTSVLEPTQTTAVFTRTLLQTAQCQKPADSLRSSGQKDRLPYIKAFPTSCRTSEQTGDLVPFITGMSFRSRCVSGEVTLSECLSRICGGLHFTSPYRYTLVPDLKPTTASCHNLSQIAQSHRSQRFLQIFCTKIVTHTTQTLSLCGTSKRVGTFPSFRAILQSLVAESPLIPKFHQRVLFWMLILKQLEFTRQCFLLFPTDIFASHLTILSTSGHPIGTRAPYIALPLPSWKSA